jgi:hypothetical protein
MGHPTGPQEGLTAPKPCRTAARWAVVPAVAAGGGHDETAARHPAPRTAAGTGTPAAQALRGSVGRCAASGGHRRPESMA